MIYFCAFNTQPKFFSEVAIRAAKNSTVIDVYTGFPDQVGLYELKYAALLTGGVQMIADSFNSTSLRQTLIKNFTPNANGAEYAYYNKGMLEVKCSPGLKVIQNLSVNSCFLYFYWIFLNYILRRIYYNFAYFLL